MSDAILKRVRALELEQPRIHDETWPPTKSGLCIALYDCLVRDGFELPIQKPDDNVLEYLLCEAAKSCDWESE